MTELSVAEIRFVPTTAIVSRVAARSLKPEGVERLRVKIARLGFQVDKPLRVYAVDGGYRLIDGNHRLEAADKLTLETIPVLVVDPPADALEEIQQARESNEASETVVPTTFIDDAELVWTLTEQFTQEQTAKAMGWSRAQVSQYAMLDKISDEAWEVIATTFQNIVADNEPDAVAEIATGVATSPFTENLLRNILDLKPDQQLELCKELAKGEKTGISKSKFKSLATAYRARNNMREIASSLLAGMEEELQGVLLEIDKGHYDDAWIKQEKETPKGKKGGGAPAETPVYPEKFSKLIDSARDAWNKKTSIQLHQGDFYELVKKIPDSTVNLILTDPPYNISHGRTVTRYNASDISYDFGEWDKKGEEEFVENMREWVAEFSRILVQGGTGIVFTSSAFISDLRRLLVDAGLKPKQDLYWCKSNPAVPPQLTGYYTSVEVMVLFIKGENGQTFTCKDFKEAKNFFEFPICGGSERMKDAKKETLHPTQKPESLIKRLMENSSFAGDLVFDGFMGVGTTAKVAKDLGRKFIGIELDEEYFAAAQRRVSL
jgi:DNA modification methylase/ParB-like chromosome segregation protein Spo0J